MKAPPWMKTTTGKAAPGVSLGEYTFTNRQSSLPGINYERKWSENEVSSRNKISGQEQYKIIMVSVP